MTYVTTSTRDIQVIRSNKNTYFLGISMFARNNAMSFVEKRSQCYYIYCYI